jgi:aminomethyltransferase
MVSRTGYTGDLGYEIWVPSARALAAWDAIVDAGRSFALQPAGIWAMDVCRIEAGLIMLDVDYTPAPKAATDAQASSPFELGLGWAVHLEKGSFVGRKALVEEKRRGPSLALVGLEIDHVAFERAHEAVGLTPPFPFVPWREVTPVFQDPGAAGGEPAAGPRGESPHARDRHQVGYTTCGTWSPTTKKYLALAQVSPAAAAEGSVLSVDLMVDRTRRSFDARVARLPFFNPARKRA